MSLDHAILGFLREQPMTGYELKTTCFDERAAHFWTADQAQVYRTLDKLETRALVTSRRVRQRARPDRKLYSITRSGIEELDRWAAAGRPPPPLRDPFLIQLRFAEGLADEDLIRVLLERRAALQERLEQLRVRAAARLASADEGRAALLERLTLDGAMADARSAIDWLDDSIERLSAEAEQTRDLPPGSQSRLFAPGNTDRGAPR